MCGGAAAVKKEPAVVVITAMESEMARFAERLPLDERLAFPAGFFDLRYNEKLAVLGLVTGEGVRRASISVTALGFDERLDLRESYFLFAGIAGVDPAFGSVGSAIWATSLVHADSGYLFDQSDVPVDWDGQTVVPNDRTTPFERPAPNPDDADLLFRTPLGKYAYELTKGIRVPDTGNLSLARAGYDGPAAKPPAVRLGDTVSGDFFWAGKDWTAFYRRWHRYWIHGGGGERSDDDDLFKDDDDEARVVEEGEAAFATTAMEDTAIATALASLERAGRASGVANLLVLRTVSDYSYQPPGLDLVDWVFGPTHMSPADEAYEAAWLVGSPVILDLCCSPPSQRLAEKRLVESVE